MSFPGDYYVHWGLSLGWAESVNPSCPLPPLAQDSLELGGVNWCLSPTLEFLGLVSEPVRVTPNLVV
jgi:hypothetical protein